MSKKKINTPLILLAIAFFMTLNQTLMVTALPALMKDFDISASIAQWVTTSYILSIGIVIPFSAAIIQRFKTKSIVLFSLSLFLIGSLVGLLATNILLVIFARIIQAFSTGLILPLMQFSFLTVFPKEERGKVMGLAMLAQSLAPAIGPILSGVIIDNYSWRSLFLIMIPILIILLIISTLGIVEFISHNKIQIPVRLIICSSFGLLALLLSSNFLNTNLYTMFVLILLGLLSLTMFVRLQNKLEKPIINFRVLSFSSFTVSSIVNVLVFAILISTEMLLPLFAINVLHKSATLAGTLFLPGVIIFSLTSPMFGKLYDRIGSKILGILGTSIILLTSIYFLSLNDTSNFVIISCVYAVRLLGISMIITPLTAESMRELPDRLLPDATALSSSLTQSGAAIFSSFIIASISTGTVLSGGIHRGFIIIFAFSILAMLLVLLPINKKRLV